MVWKRVVLILGICGFIVLADGGVCQGQQMLRYQPNSPTVSPYLNLTRFNNGGLPNYYSLVRPLSQQRALDTRETSLRQQQQNRIQQLEATTAGKSKRGVADWQGELVHGSWNAIDFPKHVALLSPGVHPPLAGRFGGKALGSSFAP